MRPTNTGDSQGENILKHILTPNNLHPVPSKSYLSSSNNIDNLDNDSIASPKRNEGVSRSNVLDIGPQRPRILKSELSDHEIEAMYNNDPKIIKYQRTKTPHTPLYSDQLEQKSNILTPKPIKSTDTLQTENDINNQSMKPDVTKNSDDDIGEIEQPELQIDNQESLKSEVSSIGYKWSKEEVDDGIV